MAGTFGAVISDRSLRKQGIQNELVGLVICVVVGFVFALIFGAAGEKWGNVPTESWPTIEMASR